MGKVQRCKLGGGFFWEYTEVSNGMGGYRTADVYLLSARNPALRRCIVDGSGWIQGFPGFREGSWRSEMAFPADPVVRFVFRISPFQDGKARVYWLMQPDGRYFADEDGFGAEHFDEVEMISWLDEEGRFTEPFSAR